MYREGNTSFEQIPSEPRSSYWALASIIVVCILFGAFWYYEHSRVKVMNTAPVTTAPPAQAINFDDLQAVANIAIPDFSDQF